MMKVRNMGFFKKRFPRIVIARRSLPRVFLSSSYSQRANKLLNILYVSLRDETMTLLLVQPHRIHF